MATSEEGSATESAPAPYRALTDAYERIAYLGHAAMVLGWDQQVMMPEGGAPARAKQLSAMRSVIHDAVTDGDFETHLEAVPEDDLTDDQRAVVREIRRQVDRETAVPRAVVEGITEQGAKNQQVWQRAKAEDDFASFAPGLESLKERQVERAEHLVANADSVDPNTSSYEVMFEDSEPYLPLERVEEIFDELRDGLVPLIEEVRENGADLPEPFEPTYDEAAQRAMCEDVLDLLGYDWDRGRLDVAPHPFMSGTQFDARVTTRFNERTPIDALYSTIHEFGHASYQLGLRQDAYGSPLGESRSSGVHESQSRFWENHVGRTRAFWEYFLPTFTEHFPEHEDLTVDEAYAAVNRIYPENLIRVEADELTYHLHIILRCEIDRAFVEGEATVEELPQLWNEKMDEYLGVVPETDANGILQDIHWTRSFAVFHGYTVGSVLAAQLDAAMREDLEADVDELIRTGEFQPLWDWMTEHVHRHGQRYTTDELIEVATGEPLTAAYFLEYAEEKFGDLYGI